MTAPIPNTLTVGGLVHVIHPAEVPGALVKAGDEPVLKATAIEKYFGANHVLKGCSMTVYPGEAITILGRSGSGKSTFLRCLNFLEEPSAGVVDIDGIRVAGDPLRPRAKATREQIRQLRLQAGMVFQEFNLFPHLSVIGNLIEAPIHVKKMAKAEATELGES
jgi:polar amino acid transport system ATP-binding protein